MLVTRHTDSFILLDHDYFMALYDHRENRALLLRNVVQGMLVDVNGRSEILNINFR